MSRTVSRTEREVRAQPCDPRHKVPFRLAFAATTSLYTMVLTPVRFLSWYIQNYIFLLLGGAIPFQGGKYQFAALKTIAMFS